MLTLSGQNRNLSLPIPPEMSDRTTEALSIVRREEEHNANVTVPDANDHQQNAELPSNNDAVDVAEHQQNADNLRDVGANAGHE